LLTFLFTLQAKYQADEKAKRATGSSTPPLDEVTSARLSQLNQLESMYEDSKSVNATLRSQIEALQSKLEKARADLQALTQENAEITNRLSSYESASSPTLQSLQDTLNAETTAKETAQSALGKAQKEIEDHLKKIEDLEQQLFELGGEIAGGRHVPPNVRVMQMPDNPADKYFEARSSVMDAVRKQNEGLMKRIEELEQRLKQSGGSVGSSTDAAAGDGGTDDSEYLIPRSSLDAYITQNEDLKLRLELSEKRYKRLMDIFTAKTDEFKACLSTVLGVKIAWNTDGDIRVTSMFDLGTQLLFKPVNKGKWKPGEMKPYVLSGVSENTGIQGLDQMINYWVREQNCVPALVASVTLECYEKMKREGRERGELEMFITADPIH
jgi:mitotic spindle assembly checkpoint protein MAD1